MRSMKRKPKPGLPRLFDRPKYRQRNIIERMFGWLKEKRRIVTRFDKLAKSYAVMVSLACSMCVCDISFRTEPRRSPSSEGLFRGSNYLNTVSNVNRSKSQTHEISNFLELALKISHGVTKFFFSCGYFS